MRATYTEAAFTRDVLTLAKRLGWRTIHLRPGRTRHGWRTAVQGDGKGFPDLVLLKGTRILVAELKVGRGKPTAEQLAWLVAFEKAGISAYIWRPADFKDIESVLVEV